MSSSLRLWLHMLGTVCLLGCHFVLFLNSTKTSSTAIHPFVPPLTHTPGMGLSIIGSHAPPPFMILEDLLHSGETSSRSLLQEHEHRLQRGVALRLDMQTQTLTLLKRLPSDTLHQSWLHRKEYESTIGERSVWDRLITMRMVGDTPH